MAPYVGHDNFVGGRDDFQEAVENLKQWTQVLTVLVLVLIVCAFIIFFLQLLKLITTVLRIMLPENERKAKELYCPSMKSKSKSSRSKKKKSKIGSSKNADKKSDAPATGFADQTKLAFLEKMGTDNRSQQLQGDVANVQLQGVAHTPLSTDPSASSAVDPSKSGKAISTNDSTTSAAKETQCMSEKLRALSDKKLMNPLVDGGV